MSFDQSLRASVRKQLSAYAERAIEVCTQWIKWLTEYQEAVLVGDYSEMEIRSSRAHLLFSALETLKLERRLLLENAARIGIVAPDARCLARLLDAGRSTDRLRSRLRYAEIQWAQLRRLARASWILTSQCARFANETLQLMSTGKTESSVYIDSPMADNRSSFLLDQML